MMLRLSRVLLLPLFLTAAVLPSACEGGAVEGEGEGREGEGEEGEREGEGTGDAELDTLVDAFLDFIDRCGLVGPLARYEPVFAEGFGAGDFSREEITAQLRRSFENPALALNRAAIAPCRALLEDCALGLGDNDNACAEIFQGLRDDGEGCAGSDECVDGLVCSEDGSGACGTCGPAPGLGEVCDSECADDLVCVFDENEEGSVCRAPLDVGDACDPFADACGEGAQCASEGANGVCESTATPAVGDPCTEDCGGLFAGLTCVDGSCAELGLALPGDPCDPDFNNPTTWCINSLAGINACLPTEADPTVGLCTALPGPGNACVDGRCARDASCNQDDQCLAPPGLGEQCADAGCADDLVCNRDTNPPTCAALPPPGAPCIAFECRDDAFCNAAEVCEALPGVGEPCDEDDRCADDLFCDDNGVCRDSDDVAVCAE